MKKLNTLIMAGVMLLGTTFATAANKGKEDAVKLVDNVASEIATDAPGTIAKIISAAHPYKDKDTPSHYVFVYDTDVKIVAHPKSKLVGKSYKGKPDVRGKKFRDEIVKTALESGTGWVDYSYKKPGDKGIHAKTTYTKLVTGSDGKKYIVCCGIYKTK